MLHIYSVTFPGDMNKKEDLKSKLFLFTVDMQSKK